MTRTKLLISIFALMLCMGALFFTTPAYASDGGDVENLTVDAVWLEGDTLNIEVTDKQTGINQTLEVSLSDYAGNSEYVSVQAVDNNGNKSNTVQFKNPLYTPDAEKPGALPLLPTTPAESESGLSEDDSKTADGLHPLTPDGTGTVTDNVTEVDGKEFFTITTEDGNVFYMIIDRQRESENVYLLNTVTEDDLAVLAEKSGNNGTSQSGIPLQATTEPTEPPATASPEPAEPPAGKAGTNNNTVIFIAIAAAVVGGAGYYFKILRPKKNAAGGADEDMEDYGDEDYDDEDYGDSGDEDGEAR